MSLKDFIVTPVLIIVIIIFAFIIRNFVSDHVTRKYFLPGLSVKIIGAIALGLIYQFYYEGGDTYAYFDSGSRYIWEAFFDSPIKAIRLIFANGEYHSSTYEYASKIIHYKDLPSYFVVRIAGIFDLLTFHTYSATAVLFALFSFSGLWAMYTSFYKMYPRLHTEFAIAIFFIPSVIFWGSGLLKDTITLGALGWATFAFHTIFIKRNLKILPFIILSASFFFIYEIKIYILLCFIPALLIWLYFSYLNKIRSLVFRIMVFPISFFILLGSGYVAINKIGEENRRYNLATITNTAEATARWLTHVSLREGGSGYNLGDFDFSATGIVKKIPRAIWVTLFRPYLWEAKNPVMALSALESSIMLIFTMFVFYIALNKGIIHRFFSHPLIVFCFSFAITFSFAVGISTYNFGTLVRYKIPMMPFYFIGLFILLYYTKRPRKLSRFMSREN